MHFLSPIYAVLLTISVVSCGPLKLCNSSPSLYLQPRQVNCQDLDGPLSPSCWNTLDVGSYLFDPSKGWNRTTPVCSGGANDTSACCLLNEPWSTCFLRLAIGRPGHNCVGLDFNSCLAGSGAMSLSASLDPSIKPQVQYVVNAIQNINGFFVAMTNGMCPSSLCIAPYCLTKPFLTI